MTGTILEKIIEAKRLRIQAAKKGYDFGQILPRQHRNRFRDALADRSKTSIIAEFKRASPSREVINDSLEPARAATRYRDGGAAAISVLTEEDFFKGSLDDLRAAREAVDIPILRKDFIFDEFQILESAAAGANAILLIVAALSRAQLETLHKVTHEFGMDALVEVHNIEELRTAAEMGAEIIGVNNRDLRTFAVSLDVSRELIRHAPENTLMVAESGLRDHKDIVGLKSIGYSGFLIGETLMRSKDPVNGLRQLISGEAGKTVG